MSWVPIFYEKIDKTQIAFRKIYLSCKEKFKKTIFFLQK